ncbi:MAG: alkyl sulfatase dimerization domain-containing protein [Myxococcota bacterium]|nr:alkyl sulfatase dimerization domain-containing protein [Myxococcota bacterium]
MKTLGTIALITVVSITGCRSKVATQAIAQARSETTLAEHTKEFEPRVEEVVEGVHVAIGYGLANSILIEGTDGVIIVDTMESMEAGRRVRAEFDKITTKPVKAIIYTHNHADHIFGAKALAGDATPDVYSHATTDYYINRIVNVLRPTIFKRSMRQFGPLLPDGALENAGIGPYLDFDRDTEPGLLRPTKTFDGESMKVTIAGVELELVFAPGETPDQIFVWLPQKKVLLPGDNIYKSFPNLYAIRGTAHRDVMDWVRSLDKMRKLKPEHLVPSHTRPVSGQKEVYSMLTNYRDAIQYVHDQTVRGMNKGLTADELVETVLLPTRLAKLPYLQEFYGTVAWSVRSIFNGYLGWFSGDAADLNPVTGVDRSQSFADLAGGPQALAAKAQAALDSGNTNWAVELARELARLEGQREIASAILEKGFRTLAEESRSANARNYYLTQALEWSGELEIGKQNIHTAPDDLFESMPIDNFMQAMAVNLRAERTLPLNKYIAVTFTDLDETYVINVRHGVAEVQKMKPDNIPLRATTTSFAWKQLLTGRESLPKLLLAGDLQIYGTEVELAQFLLLFKPE